VSARILLCTLAFSVSVLAAAKRPLPPRDARLDAVLHGVEQRYNGAKTLYLKFTETYSSGKRVRQTESGALELRKPGRMRWDYATPPGKLFLSDGKSFYLYTPSTQRAEKTAFRDTEDVHAPMAFLLGKLNFYREFSSFSLNPEGNDVWVAAEPNNPSLPYSKVEFLITPGSQIKRLRVTQDDLSILDFTFEDEKLNPVISPERFVFHLPPGAELEDTSR